MKGNVFKIEIFDIFLQMTDFLFDVFLPAFFCTDVWMLKKVGDTQYPKKGQKSYDFPIFAKMYDSLLLVLSPSFCRIFLLLIPKKVFASRSQR